jgi:hypothetical protein
MTITIRPFPKAYKVRDDFMRNVTMGSTPEGGTGWKSVSGGVGTPTQISYNGADTGWLRQSVDSNTGAEWTALYQGDTLTYGLHSTTTGSLRSFRVKLIPTATDFTNSQNFYGMAAAHNATLANMTRMGFEVTGGTVNVHTYDGVTDSTAISTNISLQTGVPVLFEVNCEDNTNIKFFFTSLTNGNLVPVCQGTTFSMAGYTGSLQPYCRTGKSAGAQTQTCDIDVIEIEGRRV